MSSILLTGGRTAAALELARAFHRAGHAVFMAESARGHLSQPSNAIRENFRVPPPRQEPEAFIHSLVKIVDERNIDLLIPTGQEIFHVARGRGEIPCKILSESAKKLDILLNKWYFIVAAIEGELPTPETMLITNQDDLLQAFAQWRELVLKPVYPRSQAQAIVRPTLKQALFSTLFDTHWIAHEHLRGQRYCTLSICHTGRITAHATFPALFTMGRGDGAAYGSCEHPAIFNWVKSFVEANNLTGQISMEFVQLTNGNILALECTPWPTGGIHLLASNPKFTRAFLDPQIDCISPSAAKSCMHAGKMLREGLPAAIKTGQLQSWVSTFLSSRDVILDYRDPLPFLLQFRGLLPNLLVARRNRISLREAAEFDIEWKGNH